MSLPTLLDLDAFNSIPCVADDDGGSEAGAGAGGAGAGGAEEVGGDGDMGECVQTLALSHATRFAIVQERALADSTVK